MSDPSGTCGDNVTWTLSTGTGTLYINGSGAMTAYANSASVPWHSYWDQIKVVYMSNGVTTLCPYAFHYCKYLTKAIIGGFITSIGDYAFYNCQSLTSITIPETVTSIGGYAFNNCTSLTSVTIPYSVTSIGDWAFYGCTSLTSANVPGSVTTIAPSTFSNCTSLTTVTLGNGVETIGGAAFSYTALISVSIPDSVITISKNAFYKCTSLTSITLGKSVTSIGDYAFQNCTKLSTVNNASSLTLTIGSTKNGFVACYATDIKYSCEYILNAYLGNASNFTGLKALCDTQTKTVFDDSVQFALPAVPERTDNTCIGWSDDDRPGNTAQYAAGGSITLSRTDSSVRTVTKEVYATWPNSFSYTLQHGDYGSGDDVTKTVTNSVFMVNTSVSPAASFTAPTGNGITGTIGKWRLVSGSEYVNESEINAGSSFSVKKCPPPGTSIVWKAVWYGVAQYAYDLNGGSSSTTLGPQTVATGEWDTYVQGDAAVLPTTSTLTAPSGTTSAAKFKTWRSDGARDTGAGNKYSELVTIPYVRTWKAIWKDAATWTFTGGKYGSGSTTVSQLYELGMKVPNPAPSKIPTGITAPVSGGVTGTLAKWTENGADVALGADISITVPGTRTFDAVWNGTTTLIYSPGEGVGTEFNEDIVGEWGTSVEHVLYPVEDEDPEAESAEFNRPDDATGFLTWRVEGYGDYDPNDTIEMTVPSSATVTAIWLGEAMIDLLPGEKGTGSYTYIWLEEYGTKAEFFLETGEDIEFVEKNGCEFKEWAYSDGSRISAGETIYLTCNMTSPLTLTAIWQGSAVVRYYATADSTNEVSKVSNTFENTETIKWTAQKEGGSFVAPLNGGSTWWWEENGGKGWLDRWVRYTVKDGKLEKYLADGKEVSYKPGADLGIVVPCEICLVPVYQGYARLEFIDPVSIFARSVNITSSTTTDGEATGLTATTGSGDAEITTAMIDLGTVGYSDKVAGDWNTAVEVTVPDYVYYKEWDSDKNPIKDADGNIMYMDTWYDNSQTTDTEANAHVKDEKISVKVPNVTSLHSKSTIALTWEAADLKGMSYSNENLPRTIRKGTSVTLPLLTRVPWDSRPSIFQSDSEKSGSRSAWSKEDQSKNIRQRTMVKYKDIEVYDSLYWQDGVTGTSLGIGGTDTGAITSSRTFTAIGTLHKASDGNWHGTCTKTEEDGEYVQHQSKAELTHKYWANKTDADISSTIDTQESEWFSPETDAEGNEVSGEVKAKAWTCTMTLKGENPNNNDAITVTNWKVD